MEQQQHHQQVYGRDEEGPRGDPQTGLEEAMWQMGLGSGGGSAGGGPALKPTIFPERPGEPDCDYYIRTGSCGYGDRCRYNHPRNRAPVSGVTRAGGDFPERAGQPICQYFMKTGTCKFGATCKYHHPNQGGSARPPLNQQGYPLRPGEKECSYYLKNGHCKFGITCKFHHPQLGGMPLPPAAAYPGVQSPTAPQPQPYASMGSWPVARSPVMPGSYVQGGYAPIVLQPGVIPFQSWPPYPPAVAPNPMMPPGGQQTVQAGSIYGGTPYQLSASAPAFHSPYPSVSSPSIPSNTNQRDLNFPERPGQPECQFYLKTGDCKFGSSCRFHHPPEWTRANCVLSPIGLPIRPGAPACSFYAHHGVCKYGPTCKFDHSVGLISYSPSASSLSDIPISPYPYGFTIPTLAASASSSDLRPELFATAPSRDPLPTRMPVHGNSSSSLVGSTFSTSRSASLPFSQAHGQSFSSSSSSSIDQGGEVTTSS